MREKYESLSVAVLRDLAKSRGIAKVSTMKKAELIEAMVAEDEKAQPASEDAKNIDEKKKETHSRNFSSGPDIDSRLKRLLFQGGAIPGGGGPDVSGAVPVAVR